MLINRKDARALCIETQIQRHWAIKGLAKRRDQRNARDRQCSVLPRKLSAKGKRWKVFFVVEGGCEAKRALATDTRTRVRWCFNGVVWRGVER